MKLKSLYESIYDRKDMPQIQGSDLKDAFTLMKEKGVPVQLDKVLPSELLHSQKQINRSKVKAIVKDLRAGKKLPPMIVAADNYIIDGHHRQVAYLVIDSNAEITVIRINLPRDKALKVYKKVEKYLEL